MYIIASAHVVYFSSLLCVVEFDLVLYKGFLITYPSSPCLLRDLCAEPHPLGTHAPQVCTSGRAAAPHRLPQLDTDSSA